MQKQIVDIAWEIRSGLQPGIWTLLLIGDLWDMGVINVWAYQR